MKLNTFKLGVPCIWPSEPLVLIMNSALRRISEADKRKFIMRANLIIFFLTVCLMQVSAAGFAQRLNYSKKNTTLEHVFQEIEKQTGFKVLYSDQKVNDSRKLDVNFQLAPIADVMEICLRGQNLTYKIDHKTIVIKEKAANVFDRIASFMSSINVEGKIIDAETGKGIPQVTIRLKKSNRMVVADENGMFRFYGLQDDDILVISSVGYVTQELTAKNGMIVSLKVAYKELEDVMVSTGYQQFKKESSTGSYSVITAKEIESNPSINLLQRLEGKVPGVQFDIRKNTIQIRGVSSYGAIPPLVVIDGFPSINQDLTSIPDIVTNDGSVSYKNQASNSGNAILSTFNPADIETITFLKDAAASAIWGARAANGVIVITTKRGKKGSPSITFGTNISTSAPANFKNMTSMTNRQYLDLEQELVDKNYISDPVTAGYRSRPVSEGERWMLKAKMNPKYIPQRDSALNVLANRSNRDQIKDYLLQRAVTQQYNLAFSGGAENSSYYISGNYTKDQPVFRSNEAEKYSVQSNLTNDFLNKRITLSTGINYSYSKSKVNGAALQALSIGTFGLAPYDMLVDDYGNKIYRGISYTDRVIDSLVRLKNLLPWKYNAIDELNYNNTTNVQNVVRVNAAVKGVVTDWLNVTVSGQVQKSFGEQIRLENLASYSMRDLINNSTNAQNIPVFGVPNGIPKGGIYRSSNISLDDYGLRAQFDINKNFGEDHHFDMTGGAEIRQEKAKGTSLLLYGYNEDLSTSVNVNTTSTGKYTQIFGQTGRYESNHGTVYKSIRRYLSYYSAATYSYLNRYFVTGSVRFDDINLLGVSRKARATPLWSAGLRWELKQEDFMKDISWISSLSLRGTYGLSGNPPGSSPNYSTVNLGLTDGYTQLPYASIQNAANANLGWEITRMLNGGLDASLFDNRLNVSFDVYRKRTTNILMNLPINPTYGQSQLSYNAGDLSGHGVELNLTGDVIRKRNWSWNMSVNFSYNTNTVTDTRFPATVPTVGSSQLTTGYPTDNFFVYRFAGLDNKGQSQIYLADGSIVNNTVTEIKPEDRVYAGRFTAPYFGGVTQAFRYKNFSLSASASYYLGHKFLIQNVNTSFYPVNGATEGLISNNQALANRWRKPGDEAFTNVPGITGVDLYSLDRYVNADINLRNAGNIRLQQIAFAYSVPKSMLRKVPFIKGINIGATVSNLGLLWVANKEGIDPDYQMTDKYNNLPPTRNYVLNLNLTL